ncbi:peptide ABC transporter substrate-binding protein [Paenibacillus montanisoli]|uniref:peptide ABC transporter substrate-binding protein n=1 Tax=Paenibacillus montanisoli TaxID=2081970 RepID=UPI00197F8805|nr:peptide ABC transporter substrate-binding protein [Paenibacillus montanisoli]
MFKKIIGVALLSALVLTGCGEKPAQVTPAGGAAAGTEAQQTTEEAEATGVQPEIDLGEVYSLALDAYMPVDEGLNSGMAYIAIDMSNLKDIDDADKQQILDYFKKYNVGVMEATYEELKAQGLENKTSLVLDGVLLKVDQARITEKQAIVEGSKFRSGDGAIGMKVIVELKDGKWKVKEAGMTWIS